MRALLVDDERLARSRLRKLLEAHPEIEVVAEASSVQAAQAEIEAHAPDLIFLDIAMPGGSGFDLLTRVRIEAHVVFVTAYDEHAVRAFEVGAVDYLLKPIEPARLAESVRRLGARSAPAADRICVTDRGAMRLVPVTDVLLVRADGDYSEIVLRDGVVVVLKETLSHWEARLGDAFMRVHRSALVSLADVARVERADGSTSRLYLRGRPDPVPVSRSRVSPLKAALRSLSLS